ncbi:PTS transporter subunit IIC [Mycoplasma iguanae]|uniref:Ascorbate-specific PTS system EIIC component n=1 Tax=Mycoplasma iguanae TaxID=292461 RepID=A0ABY5R8Q5_9MOLU|nr:PTS ascorbate transporter subunit IIC [Mycoplasma iguanae]UVD81823.1 PTS transporter subunit IIC [Mycoplasma iguanae]
MWFLIFLKDFVSVPAFLVGIFVLIGALIQRKKVSQTIISVFKVIIGFLILGGGAGVLVGSLQKFQPLFQETYSLNGIIPNNDAFAGILANALPAIATLGSLIMVVGMIANILLALLSRLKYVFLSGHVLYYTSLALAATLYAVGLDFQNNAGDFAIALIIGALVLAAYMVISPAVNQRYMRQIIGTNEIGMGHTGGFGYAMSGLIGEVIYKIKKGKVLSTEQIKFPQSLYFFRNTMVSISLTIFIFYMIAFLPAGIMYEMGKFHQTIDGTTSIIAGKENVVNILSSSNWLVTMFVQAFTFTAGVEIILAGVRLFIGELVPMFKGISEKLIKNSKAAVDCPVVFPYAPNAVIIGFLSSFAGGIVAMFITIAIDHSSAAAAVILPGLVPHFFLGATSGVFGNVKGGIWGAIIGSFVMGIFITFIPIIFIAGSWVPASNSALDTLAKAQESDVNLNSLNWGDTDYIIAAFPGLLGKINKYVALVGAIILYLGLVMDGIFAKFIPSWPGNKNNHKQVAKV